MGSKIEGALACDRQRRRGRRERKKIEGALACDRQRRRGRRERKKRVGIRANPLTKLITYLRSAMTMNVMTGLHHP